MDTMREWRVRNGPVLVVLACGIGVGLFCLGLSLGGRWVVGQLVNPRVVVTVLWAGVVAASAGGMLIAAAVLFPPRGQAREASA